MIEGGSVGVQRLMHDLDLEQRTLRVLDNPSSMKLSPMSQVRFRTHVSGLDKCAAHTAV